MGGSEHSRAITIGVYVARALRDCSSTIRLKPYGIVAQALRDCSVGREAERMQTGSA